MSAVKMVAHCIYHQTTPRERARCDECGNELRQGSEDAWYCLACAVQRPAPACVICAELLSA